METDVLAHLDDHQRSPDHLVKVGCGVAFVIVFSFVFAFAFVFALVFVFAFAVDFADAAQTLAGG